MRGGGRKTESTLLIDEHAFEATVLGGAVLGGGGGGWVEEGRRLGRYALEQGFRAVRPIGSLQDESLLLTVSAVGAPSAGAAVLEPQDYVAAVELFLKESGAKISGLISSEVGALGVVNGWVQSAVLGLPVIDAPANGRAHPLGLMGAMGLHRKPGYISVQTAVGGSTGKGSRVAACFKGPLSEVSQQVRQASVQAGGMVAVARNPVTVAFAKRNAAPGAIRMAVELGNRLERSRRFGARHAVREIIRFFRARVTVEAAVEKVTLGTEAGLDVGRIELRSGDSSYELAFWNEYMTLEKEGRRLATFPDLIMTLDLETAAPLSSAQIRAGAEVAVIAVPRQRLILGAGMRDQALLEPVEKAIGKNMGA